MVCVCSFLLLIALTDCKHSTTYLFILDFPGGASNNTLVDAEHVSDAGSVPVVEKIH